MRKSSGGDRLEGHVPPEPGGERLGQVRPGGRRVLAEGDRTGDVPAIEQGDAGVGDVQVRRRGGGEVGPHRVGRHAALPDRVDDVRHEQVLQVQRERDHRIGHPGARQAVGKG
ncbi:hypothetical protein ACFV2U_43120 [Streptomyces sp. NPDC059697]|uniref:hypothetical protein n=1 Tax=Streptomyces sp. NPDC059697 TaxID=3346912 RepID=UPI0036AAC8C8